LIGSTKTKKKKLSTNNKKNSDNNERNLKLLLEELKQIKPRFNETKHKNRISSSSFDIYNLFEPQPKTKQPTPPQKKQTKKTKSNKQVTRKKNTYKNNNKTRTTFPKLKNKNK